MPPPDNPSERALTIAVVIPAYNAGETIERALESVLRQTRPPDEIIVSDDGSRDDTATRAATFSPAVTVVASAHGGAAAARNAGDAAASSHYIAYLDADDEWVPDKLQLFESVAESLGRPSFIVSDFRRYVDDAGEFKPLTNTDIFPAIEKRPAAERVVNGRRVRQFAPPSATAVLLEGYPIWPSTALVERALLERVGGWDPRFTRSQDFDIALRLAFTAGLVYIGEALTVVHVHTGHGSAHDWISRQLEWDLKVMRYHSASADGFFPRNVRKVIHQYLGKRTVYRGDFSREHGRRREALGWYLRALAHPGGRLRGMARLLATVTGAGSLAAWSRRLLGKS